MLIFNLVSIIIPAYNEENAVEIVVNKVKNLNIKNKEIIVVDDGSADMTYEKIKKINGIKIFKHERNMGKGIALNTGIKHSSGDIIATIDADETYPAEDIPKLIKKIENGCDLAIGSRFLGKNTSMPKTRYYGNIVFSKLISMLTKKNITDGSSGLRVFKRNILNDININSKNLSWEVEMTTKALKKGFNVSEIPIEYAERIGSSKLKIWKDGASFLFAIIRSCI